MNYFLPFPHENRDVVACREALEQVDIELDDMVRLVVEEVCAPNNVPFAIAVDHLHEYIDETCKDPRMKWLAINAPEFEADVLRGLLTMRNYLKPYLTQIPEIQVKSNLSYGNLKGNTLELIF